MPVLNHPDSFKAGYRLLMRTQRSKEGGPSNPDRHAKKIVTRSVEEFNVVLGELEGTRLPNERIYSSVDERNIEKAVRLFKGRQLDADYDDPALRADFYCDIKNRWFSCLADTKARSSALFLLDVDGKGNIEPAKLVIQSKPEDIHVVHDYGTKNGHHWITLPFNPAILPAEVDVKKNAMMLWSWD